jgi:hypothetical protein
VFATIPVGRVADERKLTAVPAVGVTVVVTTVGEADVNVTVLIPNPVS